VNAHQTGNSLSSPPNAEIGNALPHSSPSARPSTDDTTICAKIANVWRAAPPPRPWVVALAVMLIYGIICVQAYEAGREAGFRTEQVPR
jgi:hypothetical protein